MAMVDEDILTLLRATFRVEAAEHIQAMNRVLLALERNPPQEERAELVEEIFREAHSLKGASNAAGFGEVEATAHRLESVLGAVRSGKIELSAALCDVLYETIDALGVMVEAALANVPHGLELADLHARLEAARLGQLPSPPPAPAPEVERQVVARLSSPPEPLPSPDAESPAAVEPMPAPAPVQAVPPSPTEPPGGAEPMPPSTPAQPVRLSPSPAQTPRPEARLPLKRRPIGFGAAGEETIRVSTGKIDFLMNQAGELLVAGLRIGQHLKTIEDLTRTVEEWNREWLKTRSSYNHLLYEDVPDEVKQLLRFLEVTQRRHKTLMLQMGNLRQSFSRDVRFLSRVSNEMGEGVMEVRMLPLSMLFDAAPRIVRDLARERGKEIEVQIKGADTELDRRVLEEIKDPLMHILRNCVDHGIESPQKRDQVGKFRQGTITIHAFREGNNIIISVADDGAGIDVEKVKRAALKMGIIQEEDLETMSDEEAMQLIFVSGVSTSPVITDTSGRGVGMDVVRKNVEALHGNVSVRSTPGKGTVVTLTLPLTLATTQELLVKVQGRIFGIPVSAVERIMRVRRGEVATLEGGEAITVGGDPVSLMPLASVLELDGETRDLPERALAVVLSAGKQRIAFLVDDILGQQDSVIKSLGKQLARVRNVAGATTLGGTGQVVITLNPSDLVKSARLQQGASPVAARASSVELQTAGREAQKPTILVADDSLIAFTLIKRVLETAGYNVRVATDGLEALEVLRSGGCNLLISDVVMPRLNGFELTAAVRNDPKLKDLPVILVTSLESREDKERGIEVGANAYIVKSAFDQGNLLRTIEQLI